MAEWTDKIKRYVKISALTMLGNLGITNANAENTATDNIPANPTEIKADSVQNATNAHRLDSSEGSLQQNKRTYTVKVNKSIDEFKNGTTIITGTTEKDTGKDFSVDTFDHVVEKYGEDSYKRETMSSREYKSRKKDISYNESSLFVSDAVSIAEGHENLSTHHSSLHMQNKDRKDRITSTQTHTTSKSNVHSMIQDLKDKLQANGTSKDFVEAQAWQYTDRTAMPGGNGAFVRQIKGNEQFSATRNNNGTSYVTTNNKDNSSLHIYERSDGTVDGFRYDANTDTAKDLSASELRSALKKDYKKVRKLVQKITQSKEIKTLEDYYNLLPGVAATRNLSTLDEYFKNPQTPQYQQAKAEITAQNQQRLQQNKQLTPEMIVAAKMQQYTRQK